MVDRENATLAIFYDISRHVPGKLENVETIPCQCHPLYTSYEFGFDFVFVFESEFEFELVFAFAFVFESGFEFGFAFEFVFVFVFESEFEFELVFEFVFVFAFASVFESGFEFGCGFGFGLEFEYESSFVFELEYEFEFENKLKYEYKSLCSFLVYDLGKGLARLYRTTNMQTRGSRDAYLCVHSRESERDLNRCSGCCLRDWTTL